MRHRLSKLAIAAVMVTIGLVVAVLGAIAAINTWSDVDNSQADYIETLRRAKKVLQGLEATSAAAASKRAEMERKLEEQGIQFVEIDGDSRPEFLRYGDQLVELPEPLQIPEPPTFLEESGGEILVAVSGAAIAGVFLVWATWIGRRPQLDEATEERLARIESQLAQADDQSARP
jgi:hypothetical protein